jgi:excisionase family DNA binding protein
LPNTGAGARSQTINGPQTVDEGVAPLSTSPRTPRRFIESGGGGFGSSPPRRNRSSQINFFTIADVAERLHVSGRTVRRWIEAGNLIVHRVGGIVRIAESDLRAFLALHRED